MRLFLFISLATVLFMPNLSLLAQSETVEIAEEQGLFGLKLADTDSFVLPPTYQKLYLIADEPELAFAYKQGWWRLINLQGVEQALGLFYLEDIGQQFGIDGPCYLRENEAIPVLNPQGRWGAINRRGQILLPFEYDYLVQYKHYPAPDYSLEQRFFGQKGQEVYRIDSQEDQDFKITLFRNYTAVLAKVYYHRETDQGATEFKALILENQAKKLVYWSLDLEQELSPPQDKDSKGVWIVHRQGKQQLLTWDLKRFLGQTWQRIYYPQSYDYELNPSAFKTRQELDNLRFLACLGPDSLLTVLDVEGKPLISPNTYLKVLLPLPHSPVQHFAVQSSKAGWEIFDAKAKKLKLKNIQEVDYYPSSNQPFPLSVKQNGRWGLIAQGHDFLVPPISEQPIHWILQTQDYPEQLYPICQNGLWGYINTKAELVIPCQYEQASHFYQGLAHVRYQGQDKTINTLGAWAE